MRKVELVEGINSSILGFGCAPMLGAKDRKTSARAFQLAMEHGINHFDLARSYGYGEAEKFVGNQIQGKRDTVILTSKFGIQANWKASLIRPIKPILRNVLKSKINKGKHEINTIKKSNNVADLFHDRLDINTKTMINSLEKSLKALKTDYLDYFMIHEPISTIDNIDELFYSVIRLKEEGKIKAFGLSYFKNQSQLHEGYLHHFDLLQFDNSPGSINYHETIRQRGLKSNIIFSPLSGGSNEISPDEKLKQLFVDFPKSVILCSMFNEKHLLENINRALQNE
jgi:aryl-alcohol dehydrogenase-like predicted oxidoreductase